MHEGIVRLLQNVRFIPDLKRNLIFLGQLSTSRHTIKIEDENKVANGSLIVIRGRMQHSLFELIGETCVNKSRARLVAKDDKMKL